MNPVVVLGATGSIGLQTIEVATRLGLDIVGLAARRAGEPLERLARQCPDARVVAVDPDDAGREGLASRLGERFGVGREALLALASTAGTTVVNGVVGAAGLEASVAALAAGNRLGLANKESLVAGGPLVTAALAAGGGELIPIDSEHSALFQCLLGEDQAAVSRLILTASGGPFRTKTRSELADITPAQALAHPTWDMGPRITIDSATLVNKGLEVIEAHFLFGLDYEAIEVVVHPQSTVHSLVDFVDGSLKAHIGATDMRIPIQYALTYPDRAVGVGEAFSLVGRRLDFEAPDRDTFRALDLAFAAGRGGGTYPAVFNAADEVAVEGFLDGRIGFLDIADLIDAVLDDHEVMAVETLETVVEADRWARVTAEGWIESR